MNLFGSTEVPLSNIKKPWLIHLSQTKYNAPPQECGRHLPFTISGNDDEYFIFSFNLMVGWLNTERAAVERLQQVVRHIRFSFINLVQQNHRVLFTSRLSRRLGHPKQRPFLRRESS